MREMGRNNERKRRKNKKGNEIRKKSGKNEMEGKRRYIRIGNKK
jgi:hypothetical protein